MTFDQIQSFYLVATLGTFHQAARRLNATQPAISSRIAALESQLGTRLFDRSGHRALLTAEGRRFLHHAERLLEIRSEALAEIGRISPIGGMVRIGASDTIAISWLPDFLVRLRSQFPATVFELSVGPSPRLRDEVIAQQLDIGFLVGPGDSSELVEYPLCECPMVFAAAPALGLHGRRLATEELERIDILTFEQVTQPFQKLKRALRAAGISGRLNPISSLPTAVLLTRHGLGLGAVPLVAVEEDVASGRLAIVEAELPLDPIPFVACHRAGPDAAALQTLVHGAVAFLKQRPRRRSIKIPYQV